MKQILDIHPGYLGNQCIVNEYRLLQSVLSGYSNRTTWAPVEQSFQQWSEYSSAAYRRYRLLGAELAFRGITQELPKTKIQNIVNENRWPESTWTPAQQLKVISGNHVHADMARIPIPKNAQQLWAQHKYSILARDNKLYRELGPKVARLKTDTEFADLVDELTYSLRMQPGEGGLYNVAQHMWGHVSGSEKAESDIVNWPLSRFMKEIKLRAVNQEEMYLLHSTALTELETWLPG